MDALNPIAEFINQVGFPIAAFAAMYYMCSNTLEKIEGTVQDLSETIQVLVTKISSFMDRTGK